MNLVSLKQIEKHFASLAVLKGVSLHLAQGEVLGLLGHNGAGKTTMMKIILGLLPADAGEVRVFGKNPLSHDFNHHRYQIGFLPENVSFYPQLSGLEVIEFFGKLKKVNKNRCQQIIADVGLKDASARKVKHYSKGMKQRLGLAQALLTEPNLLILDEPTVGLDPIATQEFYSVIDDLRSRGCSIILCSHVLPGIEKHIDNVAILSQGKLTAYGSIDQLRQQAQLPTQLIFSGCFNLDDLAKKMGHAITSMDNGKFKVELDGAQKISGLNQLLAQKGLTDLDTFPPNLEQLYRYYIEQALTPLTPDNSIHTKSTHAKTETKRSQFTTTGAN